MQPSRKFTASNHATLLRSIADVTQSSIGEACGHDTSWVSRFLSGQNKLTMNELISMLDAAGIRLSREIDNEVMLPEDEYQALVTFASKAFNAYTAKAE